VCPVAEVAEVAEETVAEEAAGRRLPPRRGRRRGGRLGRCGVGCDEDDGRDELGDTDCGAGDSDGSGGGRIDTEVAAVASAGVDPMGCTVPPNMGVATAVGRGGSDWSGGAQ
jgi:hypothetical protein